MMCAKAFVVTLLLIVVNQCFTVYAESILTFREYDISQMGRSQKLSEMVHVRKNLSISDPLFVDQWYLIRRNKENIPVSYIDIAAAWQLATGKGIKIAILSDGIFRRHKDLSNLNVALSHDFSKTSLNPNSHGTKLAGVVAGAMNGICGVGVAFNSTIYDIRIGHTDIPNSVISQALLSNVHKTDIYLISWRIAHRKPVTLSRDILTSINTTIKYGRKGRGAIHVWDLHNTRTNMSCVYDPFSNLIHTIVIAGVSDSGKRLPSSTACSAILASVYSSSEDNGIVTITDKSTDSCTHSFHGYSPAAAIVSGILALVLEVNSNLSWRDVQHLIVQASNPYLNWFPDDFIQKGAGPIKVSQTFGFGVIDASKMVLLAKRWENVPDKTVCHFKRSPGKLQSYKHDNEMNQTEKFVYYKFYDDHSIFVHSIHCNIYYLEHVELYVRLSHANRNGHVKLTLTSPSGTKNVILPEEPHDNVFLNLTIMSVHFWGEQVSGYWKLSIDVSEFSQLTYNYRVILFEWGLRFHGTKTKIHFPSSIPRLHATVHYHSMSNNQLKYSVPLWIYPLAVGIVILALMLLAIILLYLKTRNLALLGNCPVRLAPLGGPEDISSVNHFSTERPTQNRAYSVHQVP